MKSLCAVCLVALTLVGCGPPKSIQTPEGLRAYHADQVVTRLGEFQNAVIDAQRAGKVNPADARLIVAWISGDVRAVPPVLGAVDVLTTAPAGWKATVNTGWQTVRSHVLVTPGLASWVPIIDDLLSYLVARGGCYEIHTLSVGSAIVSCDMSVG